MGTKVILAVIGRTLFSNLRKPLLGLRIQFFFKGSIMPSITDEPSDGKRKRETPVMDKSKKTKLEIVALAKIFIQLEEYIYPSLATKKVGMLCESGQMYNW